MIRNIPHDTKVIGISIKAVNELNVVSEETALLEPRHTTEGSLFKKYMFEIKRVESLKTDLVDTDFYNVYLLLLLTSKCVVSDEVFVLNRMLLKDLSGSISSPG